MAKRKDEYSKVLEFDEVNVLSIDKAVYDWFDKKHPTIIKGRKVPILFGSWERFAQMQGNKEDDTLNNLRDHNGMLKLPIISIRRGDIVPNNDRYRSISKKGRPSIVVSKKIAKSNFDKDRRIPYNQIFDNGLDSTSEDPSYEVQRIPWPDFVNIPYTVTFWASYIKESNTFADKIWGEYFLSDMEFNGYFFYAYFNDSSNNNNEQDFSTQERIIRTSYDLWLEAYLINKSEIIINRTPSKIFFEEEVVTSNVDLSDTLSLDEIISSLNDNE